MASRMWNQGVTRRGILGAALAAGGGAALGGLLDACGARSIGPGASGGGSGGGSGKVVTLVHWDWWVSQAPWVKHEIARFQKANPDIRVKRVLNATAQYDTLFNLAERSHTAPDVFMITTQTVPLNGQVQKGWLLPLERYASPSWVHGLPPYTFVEGGNMFDGKIYSAPFTAPNASFQLYINNSVFRQAGLTEKDGSIRVPKTWDDVTHAAETIVKKSNGNTFGLGFGNSSFDILPWWFEVLIRGAGSPMGGLVDSNPDLRTGIYNTGADRNYTDLMQLILEWKQKGYFYPSSISISDEISRAYFSRGKFGMTVGGVWNEPEWTADAFTDYTLATLIPPQEKPKGYFYWGPGGVLLGINAKTRYPEQAWKWFEWWNSVQAGHDWTQLYHEDLSQYTQNNQAGTIKFKPFSQYVALRDLTIPGPQPFLKNAAEAYVVVNPVTPNFGTVLTGMYTGQVTGLESAFTELDGRMQSALGSGLATARQQGYKVSGDDYKFPDWDLTKPYRWSIPKYPTAAGS